MKQTTASSHHPPGGYWPWKRVWGCAALKTPFSRPSRSSQGPHFKQKSQFTRPLLRKLGNSSLYSPNFCPIWAHKPPNLEIFSSRAPKFGNFQFISPQIWKFSVHKSPLSETSISSQAPHFGNPGRTPLPEKKLSAPRIPLHTTEHPHTHKVQHSIMSIEVETNNHTLTSPYTPQNIYTPTNCTLSCHCIFGSIHLIPSKHWNLLQET